jgi:hypothetical protein
VLRESPAGYNFTAPDRSPLNMQARQRLAAPLDPRCCSAIEVVLRNEDPEPASLGLSLVLHSAECPRGPHLRLGGQRLSAAGPARLRFPLPRRPEVRFVDEIVLEFNLGYPRAHRSARVVIERFVLVPRGE